MQRIRPKDWYSVRRLDDDVTAISEPHIQEFYRCNIWHVRGRDRDMLVDSGMGVVSLREWVPLDRMGPNLPAAVVMSEDAQFCRHHGVDWKALNEVLETADED